MPPKQTAQQILAKNTDPALISGRLNVQDFIAARKAEIERLENAMTTSATSGKKRAFQTVPRVKRRRTASHDPKRVPKRLQPRAKAEAAQDKIPLPKQRPDRHRDPAATNAPPEELTAINAKAADLPKGRRYKARQKDKVWLPTHIWHMKRAHVLKRWGYMVPQTATQKQYRATHRISDQMGGAMVWDSSYYSTLFVRGSRDELLQRIAVFPGAEKPIYTTGRRYWQGILPGKGPVLLYWQGSGLVVHAHPALFDDLYDVFQGFEIEDCRYSLGSIDITGSKALSTLVACMAPVDTDSPSSQLWKSLALVGNVDSLPVQSVLNLKIHDPRMFFPPFKQRPKGTIEKSLSALESWPLGPENFELFSVEARKNCIAAQASQKDLDGRKPPGKHIEPQPSDPVIPVTILKLKNRLRVVLPWHWVLPLWLSITHMPHVHIGGLMQTEQIAFERGECCFPKDYPLTSAGHQYAKELRDEAYKQYFKRPANKRPSLANEVGDAFGCAWDLLGSRQDDVLPVVVKTVGRGSPQDGARLYAIPDGTEQQWLKATAENQPDSPSSDLLIGFVTSGNFNLESGTGTGVGAALVQTGKCLVRNIGSSVYRMAELSPAETPFT